MSRGATPRVRYDRPMSRRSVTPRVTRRLLLPALFVLGGAVCNPSRPADSAQSGAKTAPGKQGPAARPQPNCTLPTFEDRYAGFVVGRPAGWEIDYLNGTINVRRDVNTVAVVYPVRPRAGNTAETIVAEYAKALESLFAKEGGALRAVGGTLEGKIRGIAISGEISARAVGPDVVIRGGWAPSSDWASVRGTLAAVGDCYARARGTMLKAQRRTGADGAGSTTYAFSLPDGWSVAGVSSRGIDLLADEVSGVSFAYLTGMMGSQTPDGFIDFVVQATGLQNVKFLASRDLPSQADPMGLRWVTKSKEYTGVQKGRRVHGVVTASVGTMGFFGMSNWSGMISVRQAEATKWESLSGITGVVQESIRIVDAKPGQGRILPRNNPLDDSAIMSSWEYKNQVDERLSARRSETILEYQEVRSPTFGETYQAPYSAWQESGPQGPGYYLPMANGEQELLEIVNP